jgi:hypothetical protein
MRIDRRGFLALALGAAVAAAVPSVAASATDHESVGRIYFDAVLSRWHCVVVDSDHAKAESWRRLRYSLKLCDPIA